MTSAVPLLAILGYLVVAYPSIYQKFYQLMAEIPISQPPNFVDRLIIALQMCGALTAQILLPFIGLVVIVVIVINVVDTGGRFSPSRHSNRISPSSIQPTASSRSSRCNRCWN